MTTLLRATNPQGSANNVVFPRAATSVPVQRPASDGKPVALIGTTVGVAATATFKLVCTVTTKPNASVAIPIPVF